MVSLNFFLVQQREVKSPKTRMWGRSIFVNILVRIDIFVKINIFVKIDIFVKN